MNFKFWLSVNMAILAGCVSTVMAQQPAKFVAAESSMEIKGTSNLHEWEEFVKAFNVELEVVSENNAIQGISNVVFICTSTSVESDNSIMMNKSHDALKVSKYPDIRFTQTAEGSLRNQDGVLSGSVTGNLDLAGVTKSITLPFEGEVVSGRLNISGTKKIKMSDFNISAPTALLGSLKTGDEVELIYSLQFIID